MSFALVLIMLTALFGCDKRNTTHNRTPDTAEEEEETYKLVKLSDIYFPEGILDTGLGMFIWDNAHNSWVRTNTTEGKAIFDQTKPTTVFAHGMGGNGYSSKPDLYTEMGYNVINFAWGTFSDEISEEWTRIADKIWYHDDLRWLSNSGEFISDDCPSANAAEIYVAYYYDLFSAFPDYSGSEIMIYGHSYGGMLTMGVTSLMCSLYESGEMPAYMVPDKVNLLDPYFMRASVAKDIPWLGGMDQPSIGNVLETIYQTSVKCREIGIAVGSFRTSKMVCWPCTLNKFGEDLTGSYWNFCNNIVYSHLDDDSRLTVENYMNRIHAYGWDWFTDYYYAGQELKDAAATTDEEAYFIGMSYAAMFARSGIKYDLDLSGTERNTDDDVLVSFVCDYDTELNDSIENEDVSEHKTGKAKIAGFAFWHRRPLSRLM